MDENTCSALKRIGDVGCQDLRCRRTGRIKYTGISHRACNLSAGDRIYDFHIRWVQQPGAGGTVARTSIYPGAGDVEIVLPGRFDEPAVARLGATARADAAVDARGVIG